MHGEPKLCGIAERMALVAALAAGLALLGWVLWACGRGFDFSDEGFYLLSISEPWLYQASVLQFGFIYHPLYLLCDGDLSLLRRANVALTFGVACLLGAVFYSKLASDETVSKWRTGIWSCILATSSLAFFSPWLPTPSYNSLAFQALLLGTTGLIWAEREVDRRSVTGWLFGGVAIALAFWAKPTTALAFSILAGAYLWASKKFRLSLFCVSLGATGLLLAAGAWLIDGSVGAFAERLLLGARDLQTLQARYAVSDMLRWDTLYLSERGKWIFWTAVAVVMASTLLALRQERYFRVATFALWACCTVLAASACVAGGLTSLLRPETFFGLQLGAPLVGSLFAVLCYHLARRSRALSRQWFMLSVCLAMVPYTFAFGTNNNYWYAMPHVAIFWVLSGVGLLRTLSPDARFKTLMVPVAVSAQVVCSLVLHVAVEFPYRQVESLRKNREVVVIGRRSSLYLSSDFARYISELRQLAESAGFVPGEPMLDLTGHYPGALYAIGAKAIGRAWMAGGYPGSDALAISSLDRLSAEELKRAWVLIEPTGPRHLSLRIFERYGIDPNRDYIEVGSLESPMGSYPVKYRQYLWQPVR
jgi:hypothetical protein